MKTTTKYIANDNSEWDTPEKAEARDLLIERVTAIMSPLDVPSAAQELLSANKGYWQHSVEAVDAAKEGILVICREQGMAKHYPCFNTPGATAHPLSIIGRILSDSSGPIPDAWARFGRIDPQGREWQQCFFAYTQTPIDGVCLNDRYEPNPWRKDSWQADLCKNQA